VPEHVAALVGTSPGAPSCTSVPSCPNCPIAWPIPCPIITNLDRLPLLPALNLLQSLSSALTSLGHFAVSLWDVGRWSWTHVTLADDGKAARLHCHDPTNPNVRGLSIRIPEPTSCGKKKKEGKKKCSSRATSCACACARDGRTTQGKERRPDAQGMQGTQPTLIALSGLVLL
jgi:hypothetical protein